MSAGKRRPRRLWALALALALVTAGLYWPTIHHGFAVIDDGQYITQNPWVNQGLSWEAARWAFTSFYAANWHPLTWLSHQVDWSIYGAFAGGHHLTNLLLHTLNTVVLFLLLNRFTGHSGRSWLAAALFGWHPLHVESVAWVAERKDLLSTLWLLGCLWAYSRYACARRLPSAAADQVPTTAPRAAQTPDSGPAAGEASPSESGLTTPPEPASSPCGGRRAGLFYCLALGMFAAGLMCKPMLVTLPCLLLLWDYWPLQRVAACSNPSGGSLPSWARLGFEKLPFFLLSAGVCLVTLLAQHSGGAIKGMEQVPLALRGLNALSAYGEYLRQFFWPSPLCVFYPLSRELPVAAAVASALVLTGLTFLAVRGRSACPWCISGWLWFLGSLVPVIGLVQVGTQAHADRYTYIPSIGLFVGVVWGFHFLVSQRPHGLKVSLGLAGAGLAGCLALAAHQIGYWQDDVRLFTHALAHTPNNALSQNNLGVALSNQGRRQEALEHYREAIRLQPANVQARFNLGVELANAGQFEAAAEQFTQALHYNPHHEALLNNLGVVLARQGQHTAALAQFRQAMEWSPSYPKSYENAGATYQAMGLAEAAITNYQAALRLSPGSIETLRRLAFLLATYPAAPNHQREQAIQLARRAVKLSHQREPDPLDTLATAYGAVGQYSNAIASAEFGLRIARAHGMVELITKLERDLEAYRDGRPPERDWRQGQ